MKLRAGMKVRLLRPLYCTGKQSNPLDKFTIHQSNQGVFIHCVCEARMYLRSTDKFDDYGYVITDIPLHQELHAILTGQETTMSSQELLELLQR